MDGLTHDLRFGLRTLGRSPGFTLIAIVTLALGIGVNVAMLSVTSALLFRQLPFEDADQVMALWRHTRNGDRSPFSILTFRDWRERNRAFEHLAMFRTSSQNLTGGEGEPERVRGLMVSAGFAEALGVEPIQGRTFLPEDDRLGAGRTVMLGHQLWTRRFGGDPQILGQSLDLDGEPYTVIAVLPAGLRHQEIGRVALGDFWLPIGIFFDRLPADDRAARELEGVGRLQPGVTVEAARQDMERITRELAAEHPMTYVGARLEGALLQEHLVRDLRPIVLVLLAAVGFVLLIACTNLINLLLTRAAYRDQELATRTALGAGRARLIRQLLVESLLLALLGGALGLLAAHLCLGLLLPRMVTGIAHLGEARVDGSTVALTFLLSLAVSVAIGLVPALRATRHRRQSHVGGGQGLLARSALPQEGLRQSLAISELALAVVLLIGAGLMLNSLSRLRAVDPGFAIERILTAKLVLPQAKHDQTFPWLAYFDEALRRLRALPGVDEATVTSLRPMDDDDLTIIAAGDRELPRIPDMAAATFQLVGPAYFRAMGIPLVEGRAFDPRDRDRGEADRSPPVVVINESLARHFWPDESPLGKPFAFEFQGTPEAPKPRWRQVVGVVGDARQLRLSEPPGFAAYAPYTQHSPYFAGRSPTMTLALRTRGEPADLIATVRAELLEVDPHQPIFGIQPLSEVAGAQLSPSRMVSSLLSSFAALALVLATLGVYGVIAYNVAARTREIGVRMALGASPGQVLGLLLKRGLLIISIGVGLGLLGAALLTRLMSSLLYGVEAIDPGIYLGVASTLGAVGTLAVLIPAWRAMKLQAAEALHYE